jgi:hypothetical protein
LTPPAISFYRYIVFPYEIDLTKKPMDFKRIGELRREEVEEEEEE